MSTESIQVQAQQPTAEEAAAALAEAAKTAPTTTEEAAAQIAAKKAAEAAPEKPQRPENVPEKFWDAEKGAVNHEALLASYSELEKKVGAPKDEAKPEGEEDKAKDGDEKKTEDAAEAPKASEVVSKLNENYAANGKLSDEDYALAESIGHDRATVDAFIAGQEALAQIATQRITEAAGGKESMDRMLAWATTGYSAADIDAFNTTMNSADVNAAVTAMATLKSKYEAANGRDPKLVGGKPGGEATDVFTSWAEVQREMAKPEYRADHAFRTKIEQKLARSNNIR